MYIFISPADQFYSVIHFHMSNIDTFYFCLLLTVSLVCDYGLLVNWDPPASAGDMDLIPGPG